LFVCFFFSLSALLFVLLYLRKILTCFSCMLSVCLFFRFVGCYHYRDLHQSLCDVCDPPLTHPPSLLTLLVSLFLFFFSLLFRTSSEILSATCFFFLHIYSFYILFVYMCACLFSCIICSVCFVFLFKTLRRCCLLFSDVALSLFFFAFRLCTTLSPTQK
jgi:hypothetical protein